MGDMGQRVNDMFKKMTWSDVLCGYSDENISLRANCEDGLVTICVNGRVVFEGTQSDAYVTFIGISKLVGHRASKQLLKLNSPNETLK